MKNLQSLNYLFYIAALLVLSGILLQISKLSVAAPVFLVGACLFTLSRVLMLIQSPTSKKGRLAHIQIFSGICLITAAYFIYSGSNSWSVFVSIAAFIELYASFRGGNFQQRT